MGFTYDVTYGASAQNNAPQTGPQFQPADTLNGFAPGAFGVQAKVGVYPQQMTDGTSLG